jgi:hypothetical protein
LALGLLRSHKDFFSEKPVDSWKIQLVLVGAKASFAPISYFSDVEVDIIPPYASHGTIFSSIYRILAQRQFDQAKPLVIARFPPVSPISLKIGEAHRKANFSETQVDFLAGKIVFLVRASKIKIAPYS